MDELIFCYQCYHKMSPKDRCPKDRKIIAAKERFKTVRPSFLWCPKQTVKKAPSMGNWKFEIQLLNLH